MLPVDDWYGSSIGNIPIGQGISVTPMQMAAMYSTIANDGVLVEPHVIKQMQGRAPVKPTEKRIISTKVDHQMVNMLKGVLDPAAGGTGVRAQIPGYTVAGKTGTAQKPIPGGYSTTNYVASFVGFFPADDPQVEVMVVVDSPRGNIFGGVVAAPAFQQIGSFLTADAVDQARQAPVALRIHGAGDADRCRPPAAGRRGPEGDDHRGDLRRAIRGAGRAPRLRPRPARRRPRLRGGRQSSTAPSR